MANTLLTSSIILERGLAVLAQKPTFLNMINRQYDDKFKGRGGAVGDTVSVRVPQRGVLREGRTMQVQQQVNTTIPVSIQKLYGMDTGASSAELALDIDDYQKEFIDDRIGDLVSLVESYALTQCLPLVPHVAGDFGLLDDHSTVLDAGVRMDNSLASMSNRHMLVNSSAGAQFVNAEKGLFNNQSKIANQYETGRMGKGVLGFDWDSTTLMPTLTRGSANGNYLVNGANQSGSSLIVDTGTGTLAVGDVFTIAGVFAVHPVTKTNLLYLKQFTVTAAYAGGGGTVSIYPAIDATSSERNVSALPADNAAITVSGTASTVYGQSLAFHRDAFYLVTADLPSPPGVDVAVRSWEGLRMRFIQGYDMTNDQWLSRFEILFGAGGLRPELACRIPNSLS